MLLEKQLQFNALCQTVQPGPSETPANSRGQEESLVVHFVAHNAVTTA